MKILKILIGVSLSCFSTFIKTMEVTKNQSKKGYSLLLSATYIKNNQCVSWSISAPKAKTTKPQRKLLKYCCKPIDSISLQSLLTKAEITRDYINKKFTLLVHNEGIIQSADLTLLGLLFFTKGYRNAASLKDIEVFTPDESPSQIPLTSLEIQCAYDLLRLGACDPVIFERIINSGLSTLTFNIIEKRVSVDTETNTKH